MEVKHLNDLPEFFWAATISTEGLGKVSIGGESFWIRECKLTEDSNVYEGIVDNQLLFTHKHGLSYGDKITFSPYLPY